MSLDMEGPRQILGTGTCALAGRSSSLDTCFRFLENHSHRHPWARFRFKGKARPVTTVSVYNKTRPPAAIKHGRECSGNRITLAPSSPPRAVFHLCWCLVLSQWLIMGASCRNCFLVSVFSQDRWIPGIPGAEGGTEDSRPPNSRVFYKHIVGMPAGSFNQRHVGPACPPQWLDPVL